MLTNHNTHAMDARTNRSIKTAAILLLSFSGAPFGIGWLAASTTSAFVGLMTVNWIQLRRTKVEVQRTQSTIGR
jgi:hypothetical protein